MSKIPHLRIRDAVEVYNNSFRIPKDLGRAEEELATTPGYGEIWSALVEANDLRSASDRTRRRHFPTKGRFLFTVDFDTPKGILPQAAGLVYAEASQRLPEGGFSQVTMFSWISRARARRMRPEKVREVRQAMVDLTLSPIHAKRPGDGLIPIEHFAQISHEVGGVIVDEYVYGERRGLEAVDRLDVPETLKGLLGPVVRDYYNAERQMPGSAASVLMSH